MFIDEARISVRGGRGGNGCVSFRREKYKPKGGPNGGDGGTGGKIIFIVDKGLKTLMDFSYRRHFFAGKGAHGGSSKKNGKRGNDIIVKVPQGTIIKDEDGKIIADLVSEDQEVVVVKGGKGGCGNAKFVTSFTKTPVIAEDGELGEEKTVDLELKLLADVAFIGKPNAGKSTLINKISAAKAKVADYPFTTRVPNLGVVALPDEEPFIVADVPGLIKDAHKGKGMGHKFLRHIERARLLVHLLDSSSGDAEKTIEDFNELNIELDLFNKKLSKLSQIVALNKIDLIKDHSELKKVKEYLEKHNIDHCLISALTGEGIDELLLVMKSKLDSIIEKD